MTIKKTIWGTRRAMLLTRATLCLLGTGVASPAAADILPTDDPALYWSSLVSSTLTGPPVLHSRTMAMAQIAIFEAANLTTGKAYKSYLGFHAQNGDTRAAIAVAARDVLVATNPSQAAQYNAALAATLAAIPDGQAKADGMSAGAAIAAATLAKRSTDGFNAIVAYSPQPAGTPGAWQPTPPGFAAAVAPQWGTVTPFAMTSGDQFRAAPPPDLSSATYAMDYNEVMTLGAVASAIRTADQTSAALVWAATNGGATWQNTALELAKSEGMSTIEAARMLALLAIANADSLISVWDSKYHYDFWRPVTAIRAGDMDGNALTIGDAAWTSRLGNPAYPSHSSGLSAVGGSASAVLAAFFGDATNYCINSSAGQRCFTSFAAGGQDGADSRIYGGIHFRFETEAGLRQGRSIADHAMNNVLGVVPEPATWTMLILGFGVIGGALRRKARQIPRLSYR